MHSVATPFSPPAAHKTQNTKGTGTRFRVLKRARQTQRMFVTVEALVRARAPGFYDGLPGSLPLHSHKEVGG